jgi:vacuolar-type H+-ATPase subunit F/Vma7
MPDVFVIGRRSAVLPFKAAGAEVIEADDCEGTAAAFAKLDHLTTPCLVMITEDLARGCADEVAKFRTGRERSVVSIPTLAVKPGAMLEDVRALVARSIGVDLLGRK